MNDEQKGTAASLEPGRVTGMDVENSRGQDESNGTADRIYHADERNRVSATLTEGSSKCLDIILLLLPAVANAFVGKATHRGRVTSSFVVDGILHCDCQDGRNLILRGIISILDPCAVSVTYGRLHGVAS